VIRTIEAELLGVRDRFPDAELVTAEDGSTRLELPVVALPAGWSQATTGVTILVPPGYPTTRPDCFFADATLRLASGQDPASSGIQPLGAAPRRWFSWHLESWNPLVDDLSKFVRLVERRLRDPR